MESTQSTPETSQSENLREKFKKECEAASLLLVKIQDEMEQEYERSKASSLKWSEITREMQEILVQHPNKVVFCVANKRFATPKKVFEEQSPTSFFGSLVRSNVWDRELDGSYFLDVSVRTFRVVWEYLRSGQLLIDPDALEEMRGELEYFDAIPAENIEEEEELEQKEPVKSPVKSANSIEEDSLLATSISVLKARDQCRNWIEKNGEETAKNLSKWEYSIEKLIKSSHHSKSKVVLDIGGEKFYTTKETLSKQPNSYFGSLFRSETWKSEDDGSYFVDENPENFSAILEFLHTGVLKVSHWSEVERQSLQKSADFFQIELNWDVPNSSQIFSLQHQKIVKKWIKRGNIGNLLWNSATDGFSAREFHSRCDEKGPTVVIIETDNSICGAYAPLSWQSSDSWKRSKEVFLFTLVNSFDLPPTKFESLDHQDRGYLGQYCHKGYGPRFAAFGVDFQDTFTLKPFSEGFFIDHLGMGERIFTGDSVERFQKNIKRVEVYQVIE